MKLKEPCLITPRLLPGVKIGDSFVSIEYNGMTGDGRTRYQYHIDPGPEDKLILRQPYTNSDLSSGVGGGSLQEGLSSLMSFLSAAAEAYRFKMKGRESDNADLFPRQVMVWAYQNDDDISMFGFLLEEIQDSVKE